MSAKETFEELGCKFVGVCEMKEDKLKEILEELKDGATFPIVIYPTFDGSDEEKFENDKCLTPISCKILLAYITKLETNWKELKKYIDNKLENIQFEYEERLFDRNEFNNKIGVLNRLKDKMKEIESGNNEF